MVAMEAAAEAAPAAAVPAASPAASESECLARAARRKFCFCNPSARSAEKNFAFATLARAAWRKILQR